MVSRPKPPHIANSPILSPIWTDVYEKDLDSLIAVCGRRGYCKSGSSETIGDAFDMDTNWQHRFEIEDHVFFKASEFSTQIEQKYPKGTAFLWDEVGVENDSRSWYSVKNKFIKYIFETYRDRNYVLLVTAPTLKSMDISTQRLLTGYLEMHGKVGNGNMAVGKYEYTEVGGKTGKTYFKMPRYDLWEEAYQMNIRYQLRSVYIPKPIEELDILYKAKKLAYQKNLYHNINEELKYMAKTLQGTDVLKPENNYSLKELVDLVKENPLKFLDNSLLGSAKKNVFMPELIELYLDIPTKAAERAAKVLNIKKAEIIPSNLLSMPQNIPPPPSNTLINLGEG